MDNCPKCGGLGEGSTLMHMGGTGEDDPPYLWCSNCGHEIEDEEEDED
jgi:hypothetical protein